MIKRSLTISRLENYALITNLFEPPNPNIFSVGLQSQNTFNTIGVTAHYLAQASQRISDYNVQFTNIFNALNEKRLEYQQLVDSLLRSGADDIKIYGKKGIYLAWLYEKADIQLGGSGTGPWGKNEINEIFKKGNVRGFEGHHIKSVESFPEHQANPDNIKFVEGRKEHLHQHGGNFRNPTNGKLIDRNEDLKNTHEREIEKINSEKHSKIINNELTGIGIAAAIGFATGFSISFIATLAQKGLSAESLKNASALGLKIGLKTMVVSVSTHIIVHTIGETASSAIQGTLGNLGLEITKNMIKMCNTAVVGMITISIYSLCMFIKLKQSGYSTKDSLLRVGRTAVLSASVLAIAIIAQGVWCGCAGIIVSASAGVIIVACKSFDHRLEQKTIKQIRIYAIDSSYPVIF